MIPQHRQVKPITGRPIHSSGIDLNNVPKAIRIIQAPLQGKGKVKAPVPPGTVIYPREEQKPVELLEKEVKEEPVIEKVVKEEPLEEVSPPENILEFHQNPSPPPPMTAPMSLQQTRNVTQGVQRTIINRAPPPQYIASHDFVEKFAEQEKIVIKNAQKYPPPVGIRSNIPTPSSNPPEEVKFEDEVLIGRDGDDYNEIYLQAVEIARATYVLVSKAKNLIFYHTLLFSEKLSCVDRNVAIVIVLYVDTCNVKKT